MKQGVFYRLETFGGHELGFFLDGMYRDKMFSDLPPTAEVHSGGRVFSLHTRKVEAVITGLTYERISDGFKLRLVEVGPADAMAPAE
jgi:hypothetical protein